MDDAYLTYYIYVGDSAAITDFVAELGNQMDAQEIQWNKDKVNLVNGWNKIKLNAADGIKTGTMDWNNLNYMRIYFKSSAVNQIKIGEVKVGVTEIVETETAEQSSDDFVSLSDSVSNLENQMAVVNSQLSNITSLQSQIDDIKKQTEANTSLLLAMDPQNMVYKDISGNVDLLKGKLKAEGVTAGAFAVKIIDEEGRTIGEAEIVAGETTVEVKTKAVSGTGKIFVTPVESDPVVWSISEKKIGESFIIKLSQPSDKNIKFDWWIVEEEK